jgi:hypothetical protein
MTFQGSLPAPKLAKFQDYFRDIKVIACRTPTAEKTTLSEANPTISASDGKLPRQPYRELVGAMSIEFPTPSDKASHWILFEFAEPFSARSLLVDYTAGHGNVHIELQTSQDGKTFATVASENVTIKGAPSIAFPEATAPYFRVFLTGTPAPDQTPFHIANIDLLNGYRLPNWPQKACFEEFRAPFVFKPAWDETPPEGTVYQRDQVVDISAHLKPDDSLQWSVPEGNWTILRFGYAPIDRVQAHPEPTGTGLEADKMSRRALDQHFAGIIEPVQKSMGALSGESFTTLLIDSYEVGPQNWTPKFEEEFMQRRGYDLTPHLIALTGRVVETNDMTERFLWDMRRTIADLYHDNYYGYFTELCHRHGLKSAFEAYSGPYDIEGCSDLADLPMGEFWTGGGYKHPNARNRLVVSSGHLSGKDVIGAESYTSGFNADRYTQDPYALKALGDFQFSEGINKFIFHRYAMQPWIGIKPGMTMGPWGLHLDRGVTWWEQGRDWMQYLTRCQTVLRSGKPVADVLCFTGEDAQAQPHWGDSLIPTVPQGYDYEFIHLAALNKATVERGQILLANGLKYQLLMLPDARYLSIQSLRKLAELIEKGATVIGPPPTRLPSLYSYPACDAEREKIVAHVWGDLDGSTRTQRKVGAGKIIWGKPALDVLTAADCKPDFTFAGIGSEPRIVYTHRKLSDAEVYFVSSQEPHAVAINAVFRLAGKAPELWRADTGRIELAAVYKEEAGHTTVPLALDPGGSVFVVFRRPAPEEHLVAASLSSSDGVPLSLTAADASLVLNAWQAGDYAFETNAGRKWTVHVPSVAPARALDDDWDVAFPPNLGAPPFIKLDKLISLSEHAEPGVRYFSGTATYTHTVAIPASMLAHSQDIFLDLGMVKNIAEVSLNGQSLGTLWKPPFLVRVTPALRSGRNELQVRVTNVWANRLIGDEELPPDREWIKIPDRGWMMKRWPEWFVKHEPRPTRRIAFSTWKFYSKGEPLPASGLIGPVQLLSAEKIAVKL